MIWYFLGFILAGVIGLAALFIWLAHHLKDGV